MIKFLEALTKHRFHVAGVGISAANLVGFVVGFTVVVSLTR
jgi:hypothetical protein